MGPARAATRATGGDGGGPASEHNEFPDLAPAFARCAAIVRREARNFYYGLRLTPEPRRGALYAVYSWMRSADDLVDDPSAPIAARQAKLDAFRSATEALLRGRAGGAAALEPVLRAIAGSAELAGVEPEIWRAIAHVLGAYPIDPADVIGLLDGLEADLDADAAVYSGGAVGAPEPLFQTREQLVGYCDAVASTVGRICVAVWGIRSGASPELAREMATARGLAFQLTNILRDFAADYDDYRVYLPAEDFDRFGISAAGLRHWSPPEHAEAMMLDAIALARGSYERSSGLSELITPECVPTLWAMTRIYRALLDRIAAEPSAAARPTPVSVPGWRKAAIALQAVISPRALLL